MSVVLIISDAVTRQERTEIARAIGRYGEYLALSDSSYAINTGLPPEEIASGLERETGIKKGLYVIPVKNSYQGPAPVRVRQWLTGASSGAPLKR